MKTTSYYSEQEALDEARTYLRAGWRSYNIIKIGMVYGFDPNDLNDTHNLTLVLRAMQSIEMGVIH